MLQKSKYHKWEIRVKYSNFPFAFGYALLLGAYEVIDIWVKNMPFLGNMFESGLEIIIPMVMKVYYVPENNRNTLSNISFMW